MRTFLVLVALLAVAAPVYAISVDGDISDWAVQRPGNGPLLFNAGGSFQIASYNAMVDSGVIYAYVQLVNPVGVPGGSPAGNSYPGLYIDVDSNQATMLGGLSGFVPLGTDINVEVDNDTGAIPTGGGALGHHVNFWGEGNNWANGSADAEAVGAVSARNAAQTIWEWSIPVSAVAAEVANCDGATPLANAAMWTMYIGGEAGPSYGRNVGQVPEPGTIAMLIGAALAIYALRRRK